MFAHQKVYHSFPRFLLNFENKYFLQISVDEVYSQQNIYKWTYLMVVDKNSTCIYHTAL